MRRACASGIAPGCACLREDGPSKEREDMKRTLVAATLGIAAMVAFDAAAQVKPEILIKQRQAAMTLQGKYFGPLAAMAQGKAPYNATVVQRNAGFLGNLSRMPWDGFDPSTKDVKD